ncbi:MAG: nucleotidyltransferase family protein [Planctomycetota bacterium]
MDALIFAAGLGTRLAPLTDDRPKALVEVGGVPLLEHVARRLVAAGATRLVVNVCPFADRIEAFLRARDGFGVEVRVSREAPAPLETGGGLRQAAPLLRRDGPILLHNVDVLTDLPLAALLDAHARSGALATLAVMDRASSRRLLFDDRGLLGRVDDVKGVRREARPPSGAVVERAFCGVHVVDPSLLDRLTESGVFSILEPYLRLAGEGAILRPFSADGCRWIDVGRPADLARANASPLPPP